MHDPKCLVAQGYDTITERYTVWAQGVRAEERARDTHLRAKRQVPSATFIHADMTRLAFTRPWCDAVVAFYALMHVPRQAYAALFRTIASWVRPGGWVLATLGLGDLDTGLDTDWLGVPMYWSSFDRATSLRLLREAGCVIQRACAETADEDGVAVTFLWILGQQGREDCACLHPRSNQGLELTASSVRCAAAFGRS